GDALDEQPESAFAFRERFLCFPAFGEILHQRSLDVLSLFDFGIEHVIGLLERGGALMHHPLEIVARTPQIVLGLTARRHIFRDRSKLAHGPVWIENRRDVASHPYGRTVGTHVAALDDKPLAGAYGM